MSRVSIDPILRDAIVRRRTFAIISHPDAGKTTLTEKLLLYGGAIHLAGTVKARRQQRHATSDWMQMEQERGISVTSSVMQFAYEGYQVNLLDTPGHEDFSEDTYRVLIAADSAVMLLDNRNGVEERTRQPFADCKRRRMPIFTVVNKCDRVGEDPLKLLSDVEADLGIDCHPVTWPIHADGNFIGVYDRPRKLIYRFERSEDHGATRADGQVGSLDDERVRELLGAEAHERLTHDIALLDAAGHPFNQTAMLAGTLSPVFFASALTNFGVEPFMREFVELAPPPTARESSAGILNPADPAFTGFVVKIQANMDPKHRDRVAFVRLCSGRFARGMKLFHVRSGKTMTIHNPMLFLARERELAEEAFAGDILGIPNHGNLRIGDALTEGEELRFTGIPSFAPELLKKVRPEDPMRAKHLGRALLQLAEEGAAQVFRPNFGNDWIVGVAGALQFDVLADRIRTEYNIPVHFEGTTL